MAPWRAILIGAAGALPACGASGPVRPPPSAGSETLAEPAWAEQAREQRAPVPLARTYETRRIEAAPEPPGDLAAVLGPRGRTKLSSLAFHQAPVAEVLRALSSAGAFNLVMADDAPDSKVTIALKNVTLQDALQSVLAAGHLEAEAIGSNIVLVKASRHP